jgi:hypothetical protein
MSQQEFENYLALLTRLLRIDPRERQRVAEEFRSHMEDRLEELLARGLARDEAVRQALEEFGDAAGLAAQFVSLNRHNRQRWIMRLTTASAAAVILIAAGIVTFWPGNNAGPGAARLVAQAPAAGGDASSTTDEKPAEFGKAAVIKEFLDRRMDFDFSEKPLRDVAKQLSDQAGINIYVDAKRLEEGGVNGDTPITMSFRDIRMRTFLDLMLGELELTYVVKDDVLIFTTQEHAEIPSMMIARVYDCRELLALPRPPGSVRPKASRDAGGFFSVQDVPPTKSLPDTGGVSSAHDDTPQSEIADSENLIDVITTIVDPESWVDVGGPGAIAEYKGLLTVATTEETHQKVERLLNMLHEAAGLKEQRVRVVE